MNQSSTKKTNTKTANNHRSACICTRARAHAPMERACARTLKPLLLNAAVVIAILLGLGAGNVAWGQTPLNPGENLIKRSNNQGTYIVPEGYYISKIECIGGGGGGQAGPIEYDRWGNPENGEDGGIGGGGGGYSVFTPSDLTFGTVITVVVGTGGAGGKSNSQISEDGEDGYPSYVTLNGSTLVTAGGGKAGGNYTQVQTGTDYWGNPTYSYIYGYGGTGNTYNGGNGGTVSYYAGGGGGGAAGPNGPGGDGGSSSRTGNSWNRQYIGGSGGNSGGDPAGAGGRGYADSDNGGNNDIGGNPYGGGGGGGFRYSRDDGYRPGGNGADGCVRITVSPISEMSEVDTDPDLDNSGNYIVPPGYYVSKIEAWGGGGGGQRSYNYRLNRTDYYSGGRGGGGGGYGSVTPYPTIFIDGGKTLTVRKGEGGSAGSSTNITGGDGGWSCVVYNPDNTIDPSDTLLRVNGGYGGGTQNGAGGEAQYNHSTGKNGAGLVVVSRQGGNGGIGQSRTSYRNAGGGGGAGASATANGGDGQTSNDPEQGGTGGVGIQPGGNGGNGGARYDAEDYAQSGTSFGGGGGGGYHGNSSNSFFYGGSGAAGGVYIHTKPIWIRVVLHDSTSDFTASQPAVWSNLEEDKSYPVVLYHSFNSQPALNAYMTTGENTTSSLTRTGYTFAGWYSASGHNVVTSEEEIDPDVFTNDIVWDATNTHHISGELHLYAHWTPKEYHFYVNLDKNFDSDVDDFEDNAADDNANIPSGTCGEKFARPNNDSHYYFVVKFDGQLNGEVTASCVEGIHRDGYAQDGWFWSYNATDRVFGNPIDWTKTWDKTNFPDYDFDNNTFTDIYLKWKPITYDVKLWANTYNSQAHFADQAQNPDTTINVDFNRTYGATLGNVLPTTSEPGFVFRGWNTVEDTTAETGTNVYATTVFDNYTTPPTALYAKWERKIEFDLASTDVLCHGGSTGQIHVTNIQYGNGSSYTVSISGPTQKDPVITTDGTADFTGLEAGKYYVTIKDANHQSDDEKCITTDSITVIDPPVLNVTLTPHNPNCDTLNGSVEVKITGGVKPYTGTWKAANESGTHPLDLTLTTDGDSAVFEQFVDAERTYTVSVTDKNGCPAEATKTLQPRVDPFHFDYPVSKLNVCSGSKFSVNPTDFPLNPTDPPLHTTTETKNSAPEGTRYSWSMPTCSDPDLTDFNGEEGHSETDVNGRIVNTTEYAVTVTYTVTPTNGYYCIGDPFTVTVEVNPGDADNTVELTANAVDNLCVTGGNVSVTVNNAANNSTLTWVLERVTESATVHDTVQVDVLEHPSDEETISHAVPGITGCSADSVYMVYYNDASGCSSELRKTVQLEIEAWNMDEYSDQTSDKYTPNETTVNCVRQVVRPTAAMLPPITGDNAVKAGCGLATDTVLVSAPTADDLKCDGTYIYKYRYFVVDCPENYQEWTYTYIVEGEDTPPTITLTETAEAGVQAITTGLCGYRVPDLVGVSNRGTYMSVSDANQCTGDGGLIFSQSPAANTLITQTTNVTVSVTDSCGKNTAEKTIVVTVPDPLTLPELTSTGVTCYGYENGTIKPQTTNATATGGTPDYLYYVDGNSSVTQATLDFANLAGGNHLVSVKDANNCVASKVVAVEEPTPLTATVSVTDVDCKDNSTGSITIVAAGGTPGTDAQDNPVNYWYRMGESGTYQNDGRVDSVFKQLAAGTYKVYAKDANGCELSKEVEVKEPLRELNLVVSPDASVCKGNTTSVFVSANGGNGEYTYKWYTTSVQSPVSTLALYPIDPAPEKTTIYNIEVTDAKGCKKESSVTVTVNPLVELDIISNSTQSVCLNQAISPVKIRTNVTADKLIANGLPMYVNVLVNATDTIISGTPIVAGNYQYTVWGISQYGCPPKTVNGSLLVHPAFTPGSITDGEHAICYGAELPSISSTQPAHGGDGVMHYKWQDSTDNGTWSDITNVDAADLAAESIPEGSNLRTTYFRRWAKNDCSAYVDDEDFTVDEDGWVLSTGIYTLKVNDIVPVAITGEGITCLYSSDAGNVLRLGVNLGENADLDDFTYNWTLGNNEDGVPVGSSIDSVFRVSWISPATESNPKHVYLAVTETATGCVSHAEKTIKVREAFNPGTICNGEESTKRVCYGTSDADIITAAAIAVTPATGAQTPYEYRWIHNGPCNVDPDTIASTDGTFTFEDSYNFGVCPGEHTFTREAKDAECNDWTLSAGSFVLTVDPEFDAGSISSLGQTVCYNGDVNVIGSVSEASGAHGNITYTWLHRMVGEETWTPVDPASDGPTFDPTSYNVIPGNHVFTRVAENTVCDVKDTTGNYSLQVVSLLPLTIPTDTTICAFTSLDKKILTLTETAGNTTNYTYSWTVEETNASISGQSSQTVNVSWPEAGTGHLTLEVRMKAEPNCISRKSVEVTVHATPEPTISGNNAVCQNSTDFPTSVELTVTPANLTTYTWTSFDGGTATGTTANVKNVSWTALGNHTVEVKVTDANGCSASATKTVLVNTLPILNLQITPANCNVAADGVIEATASNGSAPYQYTLYKEGATVADSSNYTGRFEGYSYSTNIVTATDNNGCQAKQPAEVNQAAGFTVKIDSIHPTSCEGNDGRIWAHVETNGESEMYTFLLFNDEIQQQIGQTDWKPTDIQYTSATNLMPDIQYRLKVYRYTDYEVYGDNTACFADTTFTVPVNNTLEFTAAIPTQVKCSGENFEVTPQMNLENPTYSWNAGGTVISGETTVHGENLVNTGDAIQTLTYNVTATYKVCEAKTDVTVDVWPAVTVEPFSENLTVCPEIREVALEAQFNHVMSNTNTVTWTFKGEEYASHTNLSATQNVLEDNVNVTLPDAYDATYTYTVNFTDGVCNASAQGTVTVPAKLEMAVDNIKMISCRYNKDGEVQLHADGGTSPYKFTLHVDNSDIIQNGTVAEFANLYLPQNRHDSVTPAGDQIHYVHYPITITDNHNCTIEDSVLVWAPDTMVWLNLPPSIINLCCNPGETINITVGQGGIIDPMPSLTHTLTVQSGPSYFTGATIGLGSTPSGYNTGTWSYSVKDKCKSRGETKKSFEVRVYPNPSINFHQGVGEADLSNQTICSGDSIEDIVLDMNYVDVNTMTLTFDTPLDGVSLVNGVITGTPASVTTSTTYNYTVTATSNQTATGFAGCGSATLTGSITVNPAPTVELEVVSKESCTGGDGEIKATYQNGLTTNNRIFIALDDASHDHISNNTATTKNYTGLTHGEHTVTVWTEKFVDPETGYVEGCSASATIDVPLDSPYPAQNIADITMDPICSGGSFDTVPVAPTFQGYTTTYQWKPRAVAGVSGNNASATTSETHVYGTLSNSAYTVLNAIDSVIPTTGNVCKGDTFTVTVPVNPNVVMNTPDNLTVCSDSSVEVAFTTPITDGTMSYSWSRTNTTGITGLGESGTGNIAATALKNTTTTVQTTTFTVTPTYTNNNVSCVGGTPVEFTITVNPEVLFSADNADNLEQTKTYGAAIDDVTFSFSSHATLTHSTLPAGLSFNTNTNTLSGTPAAAGDHTVTFTATSTQTPNCGKKELTVTIHVEKAALTVTTQDTTKVYGQSDPQPLTTVTLTGLANGDTESAILGLLNLQFTRETGENVGEYLITANGPETLANYTVTYANTGKLTITKATVLVNADAKTKTYGAADPTLTATVTGLQYNDAASVIAYTLSRVAGENVGEYVITPVGASLQGNYLVTYDTAKFTITRANATVVADAKSKVYGTSDPTLTATVNGLVNGDAANVITYTLARAQAGQPTGENVGQYAITPSGETVQGNYNVTYEPGTLTITKANVAVTITGNTAIKAYDGSTLTVTGYTALANNSAYDVANVSFVGDSTASGTGNANSTMTYTMPLSAGTFSNTDANYNATFQVTDGWLKVVPEGTVIVNITGDADTVDYDAQVHSVTGYTVEIVDPNNTYTQNDFLFNGQASVSQSNAGVYPMGLASNQFVNTNTNVNVVFHVTDGKLIINKVNAEVTITGNHDTRAYDGASHTISHYVVSNVTPTFYTESDFTFSGTATATRTDAGTTNMNLADNQFTNTNPNFENVTFHVTDGYQTIEPIAVTVTVNGHTYMHEYTAQEQSVSGYDMVSSSALFNEDNVVFSGYAVAAATNPGITYMNLTAGQFSYNNPNLDVTFMVNDGWLEIVPAGIVIVNITGHTAAKDYNCAEQSVSGYGITIGGITQDGESFVGKYPENDTTTDIKFTGTGIAKGTDAGIYPMGLTTAQFQNTNSHFVVQFHVTDGDLTIKKVNAEVTITGNTDEVTYNGAAHTVTGYTISNATPACYSTDYVHFTGSVADSTATRTDFGTTDMNLEPGLFQNTNPNFEVVTFTVVNGKMTVNKDTLNITVNGSSVSREYTAAEQSYIGAVTATSTSTGFESNKFSYTGNTTASGTTVGDHATALNASYCHYNDDNYIVKWTIGDPVKLTITKAEILLTCPDVNDLTKVYDGSALAPVATAHGVNNSDIIKIEYSTDNGATWNTTVPGITNAGSQLVKVRASNVNYDTVTCQYTLNITPAAITIKADGKSKTYDNDASMDPELTATVTGKPANGVDPVYSLSRTGDQNVGEYVISVTAETTSNPNYTVTVDTGLFKITPAAITIKADGKTKVYDNDANTDPELTAAVTGKPTNGVDPVYSLSRTGDQNVGEYVISVTAEATSNPNYTVTVDTGLFKITPAAITIKANGKTKVYDNDASTDPELTVTVTGKPANGVTPSYSVNRVAGQNVGEYVISVTAEATSNPNYTVTVDTGLFKITPAAITIKADGKSKTYDNDASTDPELTATVTGKPTNAVTPSYSVSRVAGQNVGEYVISVTAEATSNPNYTVTVDTGLFKITPAAITIKADGKTKVYDNDANTDPELTATVTGKPANGVTPSYSVNRVAGQNVGEYVISVTAEATSNPNYTVTVDTGLFKITPAAITIKANGKTKVYDNDASTDPELTATVTGKPTNGVDPAYSLSRTGDQNEGEYVISVTAEATSNPNYTVTVDTGLFKITPAAITIKANGKTKVYDNDANTDPELTATVTGKPANGVTPSYSVNRVAGQNVGEYVISVTAEATSNPNYTVTVDTGLFKITPAAITIKADGKSKTYDNDASTDPELTATVTGKPTNGVTPSYSLSRTGDQNVGEYVISVTAEATSNPNYTVTVDTGLFKITPAAITIKADGKTKVYDNDASTDPELTATVTGKPANGVTPSYSVNRVAGQNVGEYVISVTAEATSNPNYTVTVDTGLFKITPAAITIKANGKTKVYDNDANTDPELTATVTGKPANGVTPSYSVNRIAGQNVGEYVISVTAEATSNPNYTVTVDTGLFKITPAEITIKANGKTKVYDNDASTDPELTATVTGKPANGVTPSYSVNRVAGQNVGEYVISVTAEATSNPNYTVTVDTGLFKITPALLTITINTDKVYDAAKLVTNYNDNGVTIEGNAAGATLTAGVVETNGTAVGYYTNAPNATNTVTITTPFAISDGISNYTVSYNIVMEIKEEVLVITCPTHQADTEKVYDGTAISYTVQPSTNLATVVYSIDGGNTWNSEVPSLTEAGTKLVKVKASAPNYATVYCQYTLKVTPKPVTITVANASKFYGENDPVFTGSVEGLVNNTDLGEITYSRTNTTVNNAGTYNGVLTAAYTANANYTVAVIPGNFEIKNATLTVTTVNQTKVYGANDPTLTVTVTGMQNGDSEAALRALLGLTISRATGQNVGEYLISATGAATIANYNVTYNNVGKLTITAASATVKANDLSKTYGDADPTLTATVTGTVSTDVLNYTLSRQTGDNVGTYPISVNLGSNPNYNVSVEGGTFTINQRPLTIKVNTHKFYDGTALVTNYNDEGVTIEGNATGAHLTAGKVTTNGTVSGTYSNAPNATNTVTINTPFAMSDGISNYNVTTNITMEIQNNTINMTCTDTAKTYDGASFDHLIPATVVSGEAVTVQYSTDNTTWSSTAPTMTDFGSQTVHVRATADNYDPKTCSYTMTVDKRYVKIITLGGIHLYDGNSFNIPNNYTIEGDGFVTGEVVNIQTPATVTVLGTCVTDTVTYETTAAFNENNYNIEYQFGQLCISGDAPITLTSASVNPNAPIYYDGQLHGTESLYRTYVVTYDGNPMPTVANSNGLKFLLPAGDTVTITPTFAGVTFYDDVNDTAFNNVFTYTITHDAFYVGPRTVKYGTVNITKRPIKFTSSASKPYDGTILTVNASALTVGGQGLASTDNLTAGLVKTENYVVGEYTCAEGGFQAGVNGVAIKEGFEIKHSSGHVSTSSYAPVFDVKLTIQAIDNFECPGALTVTIPDGVTQKTLTESELGVPKLTGGDPIPSYVTASSNIADLNPLTIGGTTNVTWTFYDDNNYAMFTCTQPVTVNYELCVGVTGYYGHDYEAVRVGSQCWFAENLRAAIGDDYHTYNDDPDNLDKFGYLYSWYTAVGVTEGNNDAVPDNSFIADDGSHYVQGICPAGWAIPSQADVEVLNTSGFDANMLKDPSTEYWMPGYEGTGESGFKARAGGRFNATRNRYEDLMTSFHFWQSEAPTGSVSIVSACIAYYCGSVLTATPNIKTDRKSVRCLRKVAP